MSIAAEKARLEAKAKANQWDVEVEKFIGKIKSLRPIALKIVIFVLQVFSLTSSAVFGWVYGGHSYFVGGVFLFLAALNIIAFTYLSDGAKTLGTFIGGVLLVIPLTALDITAVVGAGMNTNPPERFKEGYTAIQKLKVNEAHADRVLIKSQANDLKRYKNEDMISSKEATAEQLAAVSATAVKLAEFESAGVLVINPLDIMFYAAAEAIPGITGIKVQNWTRWLFSACISWSCMIGGVYAVAVIRRVFIDRKTGKHELTAFNKSNRERLDAKEEEEFDEFDEEDEIEKPEPTSSFIKPLTIVREDHSPDFSSADEEDSEAQTEYKAVKGRVLRLEIKPSIRNIADCYVSETGKMIGKKHAEKIHRRLVRKGVIIQEEGAATNSPYKANILYPGHKNYTQAA